jgi:hypothetical protein
VSFERHDLAASGNVPKLDHSIMTSNGERFAVVCEGQTPDRTRVAAQAVSRGGCSVLSVQPFASHRPSGENVSPGDSSFEGASNRPFDQSAVFHNLTSPLT